MPAILHKTKRKVGVPGLTSVAVTLHRLSCRVSLSPDLLIESLNLESIYWRPLQIHRPIFSAILLTTDLHKMELPKYEKEASSLERGISRGVVEIDTCEKHGRALELGSNGLEQQLTAFPLDDDDTATARRCVWR